MPLSNRQVLKRKMKEKSIIAPFIVDGMQAKMLEKHGFDAGYITGFGTASTLGLPDVGLITLSEMVNKITSITANVDLPFIADADTGYGNYINVMRTVKEYERAGVAALHLEDQLWPKRCGYMANKQVIEKQEAVSKIKAAVDARTDEDLLIIARTDSLAVYGWDDVEDRARSFMEAGADMVFVDGIRTMEDVGEYNRRLSDFPMLLNDVPLLPVEEVLNTGKFSIILHPGPMSCAWNAMDSELVNLKKNGTVSKYHPFEEFNRYVDILGAENYFKLDLHYKNLEK